MFVKIPAAIFNFHLSSTAIKTYCYLTLCQNCLGTASVRISTIQNRCAIASADTVRRAVAELERNGLVVKTQRQGQYGYYISSRFDLTPLRGSWIRLDLHHDIFLLDKGAFHVYLYFLKLLRKNHRAWPSLNMLATTLCLSKNTIIQAIKSLIAVRLLVKAAVRKGKHNLYTVMHTLQRKQKRTAPSAPPTTAEKKEVSKKFNLLYRIRELAKKVKRFFIEEVVQKLGISI